MAERKGQPVSQRRSKLVEQLLGQQLAQSGQPAYSPLEVAGRLAMVYALNQQAGQNTAAEQAQMQSLIDVLAPEQAAQFGADTPTLPGRPETTDVPTPTPEALQQGTQAAGQANQLRDILAGLGQQNPEMVQGLVGSLLQQKLVSGPAQQAQERERMQRFMLEESIRQQNRLDLAEFRSGLSKSEKDSLRDQKIQQYQVLYGLDEQEAVKMVDGLIRATTTPDQFGRVFTTDLIEGVTTPTSTRGAGAMGPPSPRRIEGLREAAMEEASAPDERPAWRRPIADVSFAPNLSNAVIQESQQRMNAIDSALSQADRLTFDEIARGTGSASVYKRGAGAALQIIPGMPAFFSNEIEAANMIRQFNQVTKGALVNNPRAPVAEQALIEGILPNPSAITTNPENEAIRFSSIYQMLEQTRENEIAALEGRSPATVPRRRTGFPSDPIIDLPSNVTDEQILELLPPGTYFIDPRDGKRKIAQ